MIVETIIDYHELSWPFERAFRHPVRSDAWEKIKYVLLDVLLCSIAEYFYELCRILASP